MTSFLDIPSDVHFIIWSFLSLKDLAVLQRVSRSIANRINKDKNLWIIVLEKYALRRRVCLPSYRAPLYQVTGVDIKAWVKHASVLQKNYRTGSAKSSRTRTFEGITWTKMIRGRWCLVASANLTSAKLAVWDLSLTDLLGPQIVLPLPGPVTDGMVDDAVYYVHAAVTVATSVTSTPFILVLDIYKVDSQVCIKLLKMLPGASHVRLIRGIYVGYAVKDGVDEFPQIANWKTGRNIPLHFPIQDELSIQPESITPECPHNERRIKPESCCAMGIWKNYLLVVLLTRMHIFRLVKAESHHGENNPNFEDVSWLTCLALPYLTVEASFSDVSGTLEGDDLRLGDSYLQINLREGEYLLPVILSCNSNDGSGEDSFAIIDIEGAPCPKRPGIEAARFIIGTGLTTVLWIGFPSLSHPRSYVAMYMSSLTLDTKYVSMGEEEQSDFAEMNEPQVSTSRGTPLLHTLSSCDFDDGRGIAVLCSTTGELCVLDFSEPGILSPESIKDDLPPALTPTSSCTETDIDCEVDLPVHYYLRDSHMDRSTTSEIAVVANRLWKDPFPVRRAIPGWSDNWSNFKGVCLWLPSWPRWGPHDLLYDPGSLPSIRARTRLYILGDIIPVLYNERNQGRVIFRSGERMYLSKYEGDDDDDWDFDEFQTRDILGILPFTYNEFLVADVDRLVSATNNRDVQTSLVHWYGADALMSAQYRLSFSAFLIRAYYRKKDGTPPDFCAMESWTREEWDKHGEEARKAKMNLFLEGYFNASNRLSWLQD